MTVDEKIIAAIRSGKDNKSIKILYKNTFPSIKKNILELGGSKDDAHDVFQDAVIILVRKIKENTLSQESNISGFLYTISKNLWINKVKRDSKSTLFDENIESIDYSYEIEYQENIKEKEETIKGIISQLDEKCAYVLHAILFTDKDYNDIAEELGLANANVMKVTKSRCKDKLIKLLQENKELKELLISYNARFTKHI